MKKVCLITGGSRGIGLEIAKGLAAQGHQVYITSRTPVDVPHLTHLVLDVTQQASIEQLAQNFPEQRLDVLVNNAGIMPDYDLDIEHTPFDTITQLLETNVRGPFAVTQALLPFLKKSDDARVINMSSDLGAMAQVSDPSSKFDAIDAPSYRVSKAALNMTSLVFAKQFRNTNIQVCSCSPGWCRTGLNEHDDFTHKAPNSATQGADTPIWLALDAEKINGQFFYQRQPIAW